MDIHTLITYFSSPLPSFYAALCVNSASQKIFSKTQTATLRREGERGHFWAGGDVFASQFEESGFDMSWSQQVLSAIVGDMLLSEFITLP